jgi:N-acetylmuramoyl-L-alanine amidase
LLAWAALAGCQQQGKAIGHVNGDVIDIRSELLSVYQLAGRLDMRVTECSASRATLENDNNLVMIFADPHGRAFVNGSPVGSPGGITAVSHVLFVPTELEARIRFAMRPPIRPPGVREPPRPRQGGRPPQGLWRVVVDAGHGGKDPGAISVLGFNEKSVNLAVAVAMASYLEQQGLDVVMTRGGDEFVELERRAEIANQVRADLFVSLHSDVSAGNSAAEGATVYVSRSPTGASQAAANAISARLARLTGGNGIRQANYRVLVQTVAPAVLVELGYLSNRAEAAKLNQPAYQQRLAEEIGQGVLEFLRRR